MAEASILLRPMQKSISDRRYTAQEVMDYLDGKIAALVGQIQQKEYWKVVSSPDSDPRLVQAIMRELYLEIYFYEAQVVEASIACIAQFPRSLEERKFKAMLNLMAEEFTHGEVALNGYVALGGDKEFARNAPMSPGAVAMLGVWLAIQYLRDPFVFLGAEYLFENLTSILAEMIEANLAKMGVSGDGLVFITTHAKEDIQHSNLMRHLIEHCTEQYDGAGASIMYGMDCLLFVYPLAMWDAVYERAKAANDAIK
ncbi:MAG: iron-containing redox enzyme family protein [Capsulimonadales bacterium]|nr:iron-containing redox enzyme family protein [Capsulimonadales bacterium]